MDPTLGKIQSNIYTVERKNQKMNEILWQLNKVGVIEEEKCKSILTEPNSQKRLKTFGKVILESGEKGFDGFISAFKDAKKDCKFLNLVFYSLVLIAIIIMLIMNTFKHFQIT